MKIKILILSLIFFVINVNAQKKVFVEGFFINKKNDTIKTKFYVRTNLYDDKFVSLDSFYRRVRYSNNEQLFEISTNDIKYIEFIDLKNNKVILTSHVMEPILNDDYDLYVKVIEGKISWYQGISWDSYNGLDLDSFFFRKDINVIYKAGFLDVSEKNAVINLIGEKDLNKIFIGDKKINGGNLKKIKKYIKEYNEYYKDNIYLSPYYE